MKQVENQHYFMFETLSVRVSDFSETENPSHRNFLKKGTIVQLQYFLKCSYSSRKTNRRVEMEEVQISTKYVSLNGDTEENSRKASFNQ